MKRYIFGIFILAIYISSCTVYKEYPIDVYKPGAINVPPNVENVALVYRNFKYGNDTLQHYYKYNNALRKAKNDPAQLDSILANYCISELAANIDGKKVFNRIHIFPEIFKAHKGQKLPPLDFGVVKKITQSASTDLLVSLETFSYFYSEFESDYNAPKPREVVTAAVWAVYDPQTEKLLERKTMIDTLYWNALDQKGNVQKNTKLPPRLMALKIAAQMAGENYSKRFFASWETVTRMYSIPPLPDFEAAEKYIKQNDWDNAIMLWKRYADDQNGKMAINARYNLALAYEMKDDLITANKWLTAAQALAKSYNSRDDLKMIAQYQSVLAKRLNEVQQLNNGQ